VILCRIDANKLVFVDWLKEQWTNEIGQS